MIAEKLPMDANYVSPSGDSFLVLGGKLAKLIDLKNLCEGSGIPASVYFKEIRIQVSYDQWYELYPHYFGGGRIK